jgi:acyl-CoA reductase-like NAD-dependent aldehyde dehydrogenase
MSVLPGILIDNKVLSGTLLREVVNPATEAVVAKCATGDIQHIDLAVQSSVRAFATWSLFESGRERGLVLLRFADLIDKHKARIVATLIVDAGKPTYEADLEVTQTAAAFRFFGGVADKIHGQVLPHGESHLAIEDRVPVGVVGVISPWNFPIQLMAWRASRQVAKFSLVFCCSFLRSARWLRDARLCGSRPRRCCSPRWSFSR